MSKERNRRPSSWHCWQDFDLAFAILNDPQAEKCTLTPIFADPVFDPYFFPDARRSELTSAAETEVALLPQPKYKRMPTAAPVTTTQMESDDNAMPEADFGFDDPAAATQDEG